MVYWTSELFWRARPGFNSRHTNTVKETCKEIVHFLENGLTVGLEPAIMQSQGHRPSNCVGGCEGGVRVGGLEPSEQLNGKAKNNLCSDLLAEEIFLGDRTYKR